MNSRPLNRPFVSYVLTQSMLVLIVMAASFLIVELLRDTAGVTLDRFWISAILVLFAQLPVAIMYARTETRNLTTVEGWGLSIVFVGVTLAFEIVLQSIAGQKIAKVLGSWLGVPEAASNHQTIWVIGFIVGLLLASFMVKMLFQYAVRNNLSAKAEDGGLLNMIPGLNAARFKLHRPSATRDYSELYRRELIGMNVGIFGLSLMVFGPQFMHVLKLSIPLSFVFAVVCVANRMARVERTAALSQRCLNVAIQMLPLTVVSMILLGLSTLYANYVSLYGSERDVVGYAAWLVAGLGLQLSDIGLIATYLGVLFAICLAANTLMLVLFARLIRPLVCKTARVTQAKSKDVTERLQAKVPTVEPYKVMLANELRARSRGKAARTQRPIIA